jgi:hypothetical protein
MSGVVIVMVSRTFLCLVGPLGLDSGLANWVDGWRPAGKWPAGFLPIYNLFCTGPFSSVPFP